MTADRGKVRQGRRSVTVEQPAVIEDHQARTRCRTSSGHGAVYRTGRSVPSHPLNRLSTIKRIVGDLIPYQNDREDSAAIARKGRENVSEYSTSCMDMRTDEALISGKAGRL